MANEAVAQPVPDPLVWESFLWGLLSAVSLNIGSVVGVTCLPRRKVRAMLMSFGGGSLLFALSIELFGHVLSRSEERQENTPVWIMEGSAILGGILFAMLNKVLNVHGADVRKPSTTKGRFMRLRGLLMRRLALRLWKIPFFTELTLDEIKELIQSAMNKERFRTGDIIISHDTRDSAVFFILSGMVRVFVSDQDGAFPASPQALLELREEDMARHHQPLHQHLTVPAAVDALGLPELHEAAAILASDRGSSGSPLPVSSDRQLYSWDLGPDKMFGDMAVLTGTHHDITALALEGTKVLVLPCHEVLHVIDRNLKVRSHVSLCALENMRQLECFQKVPDCVLRSMLGLCRVESFQPGEVVFEGTVTESTSIMSVILGVVEVTLHHDRSRTTLYGSDLLCTEHVRGFGYQAFTATAVEATSVLVVDRWDFDQAVQLGTTKAAPTVPQPHVPGTTDAVKPATVVAVPPKALAGEGRQQGHHQSQPKDGGTVPHVVQVMPVTPATASGPVSCRRNSDGTVVATAPLPGQVGDERPAHSAGSCRPYPAQAWSITAADAAAGGDTGAGGGGATSSVASLGRDMGWEPEEDPDSDYQDRMQFLPSDTVVMEDIPGLVTDQDLEEREQDIAELRAELNTVRSPSKGSSNVSGTKDTACSPEAESNDTSPHPSPGGSAHAAIMVWLGILIDAIPESLVIGILINKSAATGSSHSSPAEAALPFVIGVFLSNLPESMSSSGSMKAHGIQVRNILLMWWTITFLTALGASIGALLFPPGSSEDPSTEFIVSGVEGLAAGAMLTMIAQTMLPEAFEQGGDIVGLSCLAGFLCALTVKLIPFPAGDH